jgi:isopentenyldiphosphate isomerase
VEIIDIYDINMKSIGTSSRENAHLNGYWHKSFHCWFYTIEDKELYLLLQKRQSDKESFPNLLDVTVAGHLQSGEEILGGIREI